MHVDPILHVPGSPACASYGLHTHWAGTPDARDYLHGRPYTYRHAFQWRIPAAVIYKAAERRRIRVALNRYPGVVIGVAVQIGHSVLSILWGRPGRIIETTREAS